MLKAYLETNVICRAQESGISGYDLRKLLERNGLTSVVGLHVIYELARTFLNERNTDTAIQLFTVLKELSPEFSNQPGILVIQEANNCLGNDDIVSFLDGTEKQATIDEIIKLSKGSFDRKARKFIETRDANFQQDHKIMAQNNIELFKNNPPSERLRTFEDVFAYYQNDLYTLIIKIFNGKLSEEHALAILNNIDRLHSIRTRLRADIYLLYVELVQKVVPAKDKVDDHRHIVEAAYCEKFITNDTQLIKNTRKINPNIEVIEWASLL